MIDRKPHTSPDGESRPTGASDSYLGDLLRQRSGGGLENTTPASPEEGGWDGTERRRDGVGCYDPYIVEITRSSRSSDF